MSVSKQKKETETNSFQAQSNIEKKYAFIKDRIIFHYKKGCRILNVTKITVAVLFLIFSLIAVVFSNRAGSHLEWLTAWIILIFLNIAVFTLADYAKYLIRSKLIPYLEDDERVEFGEYDIFLEDEEEEEE